MRAAALLCDEDEEDKDEDGGGVALIWAVVSVVAVMAMALAVAAVALSVAVVAGASAQREAYAFLTTRDDSPFTSHHRSTRASAQRCITTTPQTIYLFDSRHPEGFVATGPIGLFFPPRPWKTGKEFLLSPSESPTKIWSGFPCCRRRSSLQLWCSSLCFSSLLLDLRTGSRSVCPARPPLV